jgi:hypothetical protein
MLPDVLEAEPKGWNSLDRICQLMSLNIAKWPELLKYYGKTSQQVISVQVPGNRNFKYHFSVHSDMPVFTYLCQSREIYERLIIRATLVQDIDELDLD